MKVLGHMQSFCFAATHYNISNQTLAMQKDGQQSFAIGFLAWERINLIIQQIKMHTPKFNVRYTLIPYTLIVIAGWAHPFAKSYSSEHPDPITKKEKIVKAAFQFLEAAGKASQDIFQHADKVLNAVCIVNAVALVSLGFPVTGSIAILGLFVLALKRYRCLPASIESYMQHITIVASLATTLTTPTNIILRIIGVAFHSLGLTGLILNSQLINSRLHARFTNPFYNKHVVNEAPGEQEIAIQRAAIQEVFDRFRVNPTYVYSNEVGRLLSSESDQSLAQISASTLFDHLTTRIQQSNITLSEGEKEGLNNFKICATTGRVTDTAPPDIELFQKIIKLLIQSILNDDDNFSVKVKEFANLGNSCVAGWTRDINAMLFPQTKEVAWAVHHVLAKMRGEIVKEKILTNEELRLSLERAGGANNIHLTDAVQGAFWHRIRTFEGELTNQLHKFSVLSTLFFRLPIMNDNTERLTFIESFYMVMAMQTLHPGISGDGGRSIREILRTLEPDITRAVMNPNIIVNAVYDAIKPEYKPVEDGRIDRVESKRVIAWEAIQTWMADIAEKRKINIYDPDTYEFNPIWIERDIADQHYLSKAGVKLLLWDLGILTCKGF